MSAPVYMLDTNICIYIRRERPQEVLRRFEGLPSGAAAISVITHGELRFGARKSRDPERASAVLDDLAILIPVLPLTSLAGDAYGRIRHDLSRKGEIIGNNDLWIAAHALSLGLILVTNNAREFERVRDLRIENWADSSSRSGR